MKKKNELSTVGQRIKYCREMRGMTQVDLADAIGVGRSTFQEWEKDTHLIKSDKIASLCDELHVSADFLLGTGFLKVRPNEDEVSSNTLLEILSDSDAKEIFYMIEGLSLHDKRTIIEAVRVIANGMKAR